MRHPIDIKVIKCESEKEAKFQLSRYINEGMANNKCFYNGFDKEQQFYIFIELNGDNAEENKTTLFVF